MSFVEVLVELLRGRCQGRSHLACRSRLERWRQCVQLLRDEVRLREVVAPNFFAERNSVHDGLLQLRLVQLFRVRGPLGVILYRDVGKHGEDLLADYCSHSLVPSVELGYLRVNLSLVVRHVRGVAGKLAVLIALQQPFPEEVDPIGRTILEPVVVSVVNQACDEVARVEEPRGGEVFVYWKMIISRWIALEFAGVLTLIIHLESSFDDPAIKSNHAQDIFRIRADLHHTALEVDFVHALHTNMEAGAINSQPQRLKHTANHLAVTCIVEFEVVPVKELRLEAYFDIYLNPTILARVWHGDGKEHTVDGENASSSMTCVECGLDLAYGSLPIEIIDDGFCGCEERTGN